MDCTKIIDLILSGDFSDSDTGRKIILPVKAIRIGDSLLDDAGSLLKEIGFGQKLAAVYDSNTYDAAGKKIIAALSGNFLIEQIRLEGNTECDVQTAEKIIAACGTVDNIIAIGSGTINDLCKYASSKTGRGYAVFGTAPSMNGYCSSTSSMKIGKYKTTVPTTLPAVIFLVLGVIGNSPLRLIRSGFGDLLCRSTAQADWLLSHLLLGTPYKETPFEMLKPFEEDLMENCAGIVAKDPQALKLLCASLILSGIGMHISGGSYPASQGEHMIAHYVDMLGRDMRHTYHGEQIGVTTLTMSKMQERFLQSRPVFNDRQLDEDYILQHFGKEIGEECIKQCRDKWRKDNIAMASEKIGSDWDSIRQRIAAVTVPAAKLRGYLKNIGAIETNKDLGWSNSLYDDACNNSVFLRNRFTFLDLQYFAG